MNENGNAAWFTCRLLGSQCRTCVKLHMKKSRRIKNTDMWFFLLGMRSR